MSGWKVCAGFWERVGLVHRWSNPEPVEVLTDSALAIWGMAFLFPGNQLLNVPALAPIASLVPDWTIGLLLTFSGLGQFYCAICRRRPWRRLLLLVTVAWWLFLVASIVLERGFTPALGTYVPLLCGAFWAQVRVGLWEAGDTKLRHDSNTGQH